MALGLELAGFKRWERCMEKTNMECFRGLYRPKQPVTCCENIWVDLQTASDEECRIESNTNSLHHLLALRFPKAYPTEKELAGTFDISEKTVRKWSALYVQKIQLLQAKKVSDEMQNEWPNSNACCWYYTKSWFLTPSFLLFCCLCGFISLLCSGTTLRMALFSLCPSGT